MAQYSLFGAVSVVKHQANKQTVERPSNVESYFVTNIYMEGPSAQLTRTEWPSNENVQLACAMLSHAGLISKRLRKSNGKGNLPLGCETA